jgi:tubulin-specific chaperone A
MAQEQVILTLRVDGVDKAITSTEQLNSEIKELEKRLASTAVGSKGYRELNTQLVAARRSAAQLNAETAQGGKAFGGLGKAVGGVTQGVAGLSTKALGLIGVVIGIVTQFLKFEAVADLVEKSLAALNAGFGQIVIAVQRLAEGDFSGAFRAITTELVDAATASFNLTGQLQALEDRERELTTVRALANKEVAVELAQAKNRSLSLQERIALLDKAAAAEQGVFEQELALAKERERISAQLAEANKADEEREEARVAAVNRVIELETESLALRERISARRAALIEAEIAEQKRLADEAKKRRDAEIDAQLALEKARNQLAAAQLGNAKSLSAELERIRLNEATANAEFRARELKGEKVLAEERSAVAEQFANERQALRDAEAAKQLEAVKEITTAQVQELEAVRDATDQSAQVRLAAELKVLEIKRGQIEADRALKLSGEDLSDTQVQAINATADAALAALDRASGAVQARVGRTPGGLIGQLFGFSEKDFEEFNKRVQDVEAIARGIGETFAALAQVQAAQAQAQIEGLQEQAQVASELAEEAQNQADASAERAKSIEQNLFTARVDQRARLIALVERERQAQARQNAEAQSQVTQAKARQEEIKQLQREQAEIQKALQLFNIITNTASAIIGFQATPGGIPGTILSVLAGITGAAQAAVVASTPIPTFAQGGYTGSGFGRRDGSGFRPAGIVHEGEYVVPKFLVNSAKTRPLVAEIEQARRAGLKGYAEGGQVSAPSAPPVVVVSVEAIDRVRDDVQRVDVLARL